MAKRCAVTGLDPRSDLALLKQGDPRAAGLEDRNPSFQSRYHVSRLVHGTAADRRGIEDHESGGTGRLHEVEGRANGFQIEGRRAAGDKHEVGKLCAPARGGVGGGACVDHHKVEAFSRGGLHRAA